MPKKTASKELDDKNLFDSIAREYAKKDMVPSSMIARRAQLLSAVQPVLGGKKSLGQVVDIGCGMGTAAKYLKGKYSSYIGIDQSKKEIELAKSLFRGNPKVKFLAENIKNVKLRKKADVVLSLGALHHMTDLPKVFRALENLAKPEATLLVIEPQRSNVLVGLLRKMRKTLDRSYSKDQIYFEEEKLTGILEKAGFSKIVVDFQGFFGPYFAQVILPPQIITQHLSALATLVDRYLNRFPRNFKKTFSFNIIIRARFSKDKHFHAKKAEAGR